MKSAFSFADHEFGELLWENGQIVVHEHQPKKITGGPFVSHQESRSLHSKEGRPDRFDLVGRGDIGVPEGTGGDDIVPWMSYPVDADFCSDFLDEFSIAGLGSVVDIKDSANASPGPASRLPPNQPPPQQCQQSPARTAVNDRGKAVAGNSAEAANGAGQDATYICPTRPTTRDAPGFINFSFFSRPAGDAGGNRQFTALRSLHDSPPPALKQFERIDKLKSSTVAMPGQSASASLLSKLESKSSGKPSSEPMPIDQPKVAAKPANQKSIAGGANDNAVARSVTLIDLDAPHSGGKEGGEATVGPSSVCSVNDNGVEPSEQKHREKKARAREESCSNHSDQDLEDEMAGVKKSANSASKKKSRATEVHNLSERRRRERINEKMRALQELIPNCNKTDKASMLEDAIEYLKSLHLQVQMMSMGGGVCMPAPMMLPPEMRHFCPPGIPNLHPMAVGMGMGMGIPGYGMRMYDMHGQPGCPVMPVPPMHRPPFVAAHSTFPQFVGNMNPQMQNDPSLAAALAASRQVGDGSAGRVMGGEGPKAVQAPSSHVATSVPCDQRQQGKGS